MQVRKNRKKTYQKILQLLQLRGVHLNIPFSIKKDENAVIVFESDSPTDKTKKV